MKIEADYKKTDKVETFISYMKAEEAKDWAEMEKYLHQDLSYSIAGAEDGTQGKDSFLQRMKLDLEPLKDWEHIITGVAEAGDRLFIEMKVEGFYSGKLEEYPISSAPLELHLVLIYKFQDSLIREMREYSNSEEFEKQMKKYLERFKK